MKKALLFAAELTRRCANGMCRSVHLALLFASGAMIPAQADPPHSLIGTWILERYIDTPQDGEPIFTFGRAPLGHFIFTRGGHVFFAVMRNPPDITNGSADPDPDACVPVWYCAYAGTYTVDYAKHQWVTHVTSGNIPGFLGTLQPRQFRIEGQKLIIAETYLNGAVRITTERVFVREGIKPAVSP